MNLTLNHWIMAYVHSVDDTVRLCFVSSFSSALFCRNTTPDRMFFVVIIVEL